MYLLRKARLLYFLTLCVEAFRKNISLKSRVMSEEKYHSASHCKYLTQYHKICNDYNYHIKALEVMPDHIHIFVVVPQTVASCDVVRTLKSISAIELFKAHSQLKKFYAGCGALWSGGYFVSTVERISESTVVKYIEEQKK